MGNLTFLLFWHELGKWYHWLLFLTIGRLTSTLDVKGAIGYIEEVANHIYNHISYLMLVSIYPQVTSTLFSKALRIFKHGKRDTSGR